MVKGSPCEQTGSGSSRRGMLPRPSAPRQHATALRHQQRGQTLVIVALMAVTLVAVLALAIDGGNIYSQRRRMQNAADAGALAGARALAADQGTTGAQAAVDQFAAANGAQTWTTDFSGRRVTVTAGETFRTYFASVIGIRTFDAQATAAAEWYPAIPNGLGLVPLAVEDDVVVHNLEVQINDSEAITTNVALGRIGDGQRGWVDLNNDSVPKETELSHWIYDGYPYYEKDPALYLPSDYYGSQGTMTAALHAVEDIVNAGHNPIYLPVYDSLNDLEHGSDVTYHLIGFAAFRVSYVKDTGNPKLVEGHFEKLCILPEGAGESPVDYGVRSVHLVR